MASKTKSKKAKVKQTKKAKTAPKKVSHEIVVRVQPVPAAVPTAQDLEPIQSGSKYMIPKTWMSERQVVRLVQKTPPQHVYERPGKGGQKWSYITGNYVEKVLNFTFGWNWDFEVVNHGREVDQVWVLGKLTVKDDKGHQIVKTQFGRADIKFKKDSKIMLDYGNDLKSATTDALKKAASLLGIASDIYGKAEFKQEAGREIQPYQAPKAQAPTGEESQEVKMKPGQIIGPDGYPTWACAKCGDPVSEEAANYSLKVYGKRLCREHQTNKSHVRIHRIKSLQRQS
jgi:hypothetical protein